MLSKVLLNNQLTKLSRPYSIDNLYITQSSSTNTSATMETSVVPSIAHLAAATAEDALSVSGLPPPNSSTSLNVSPNHRYTLTPHSNTGDSPAAPITQLTGRSDAKTTGSSPGLGIFIN